MLATEDMALSNEGKEWIQNEIREDRTAKGWAKFKRWLKNWGAVNAAITGSLALVAITLTSVIFAVSESSRNSEFRGSTTARLNNTDTQIRSILALLSASTPSNPKSQKQARDIIAAARKGSAPIPESVVEQAGRSFAEASQIDPQAWAVALDYVSYRSSLNVAARPIVGALQRLSEADENHYM